MCVWIIGLALFQTRLYICFWLHWLTMFDDDIWRWLLFYSEIETHLFPNSKLIAWLEDMMPVLDVALYLFLHILVTFVVFVDTIIICFTDLLSCWKSDNNSKTIVFFCCMLFYWPFTNASSPVKLMPPPDGICVWPLKQQIALENHVIFIHVIYKKEVFRRCFPNRTIVLFVE